MYKWIDKLVPTVLESDRDLFRKGRLLISSTFAVILFSFAYCLLYAILGFSWGVLICLYGIASAITCILLFRSNASFRIAGNFFSFSALAFFAGFILTTGGITSPVQAWLIIVPVSAFLLADKQAGIFWSAATVALLVTVYAMGEAGVELVDYIPAEYKELITLGIIVGLLLYVILVILGYERGKERVTRRLTEANHQILEKSRELEARQAEIQAQNREIHSQRDLLKLQNQEIRAINANLEEIVRERTLHLRQAKEERDTFLYESAHALRRPLVRIMGLIDLMQVEQDPDEIAMLQGAIDFTTRSMDAMLHKLIMINEVNQNGLEIEPLDLNDFYEELYYDLKPRLEQGGVKFEWECEAKLEYHSDYQLLQLLLLNLLENAIQFCRKQQDQDPLVRVRVWQDTEGLNIEVCDNGIGIPEACQDQVFKMFFRATELSTGNGLGLYMVRKILDKLNGTIEVDSQPGKFTHFKVFLPHPQSGNSGEEGEKAQ